MRTRPMPVTILDWGEIHLEGPPYMTVEHPRASARAAAGSEAKVSENRKLRKMQAALEAIANGHAPEWFKYCKSHNIPGWDNYHDVPAMWFVKAIAADALRDEP